MSKVKFNLKNLVDQEVIYLLKFVATRMGANVTLFPAPAPPASIKRGTRYWLRMSANVSAGPGPTSDPATEVAP